MAINVDKIKDEDLDKYFLLDETKEIIYTDYNNDNEDKIYDVNGKELTQEELINAVNKAENSNFYTIEEIKEKFRNNKT